MARPRTPSVPKMNGQNGYAFETTDQGSSRVPAGLRSLQSTEEKRLFDIVDKLRSLDINRELDLPQLVVCGSQSSGKSSVLEAISELPFPRADKMCTKFVTEIQYRRAPTEEIRIEIIPDKMRSEQEQRQLRDTKLFNQDLQQLPAMIQEAEKRLGISGTQDVARDVLKVQITGPEVQPLTLVDLPGLIEAHTKGRDHINFVQSIVDDWINEQRSIILAVVEASSDPERQSILIKTREVDPNGDRTFGIITKPDIPEHGSNRERYWIDHARNISDSTADFNFKKGWHVLRNRNFTEKDNSASTRDMAERQFFQDPHRNWHVVDQRYWGIDSLRKRLRTLLYEHTKTQLPQVRSDIADKLEGYTRRLRSIEARLHKPEQLWADYQRECKELATRAATGVDGKYNDSFYYDYNGETSRFLRSRIEDSNDAFVDEMTMNGHGFRLPGSEAGPTADTDSFMEEVKIMLRKTRGEELPGHFDPQRLNMLFGRHSMRWYGIAQAHVGRAYGHCVDFVAQMINVYLRDRLPLLPIAICSKMVADLKLSLQRQKEFAWQELDWLEQDRKRSAKTRNKTFIQRSERRRAEKIYLSTMRTLDAEDNQLPNGDDRAPRVTPKYLQHLSGQETQNSPAEFLGTDMLIYYDIARDVFVDNVLIQVIERHLLAPLSSLFHGDFGIDQDTFFSACNDEDKQALEIEKKELAAKVATLAACHAELK